jgi:hypothetical protein
MIACTKKLPSRLIESVLGQLPKEISRFTVPTTSCTIEEELQHKSCRYKSSKIPSNTRRLGNSCHGYGLDLTDKNRLSLEKYELLVKQTYQEPIQ